jgi:prepilin-type processing-associated H-X9-DG protein
MYLNKSDDLMPVAAQLPSENLNNDPRIVDVLAPEIDNATNVFKCPSDDKGYFQNEGSSYEYNSMLSGRKLEKVFLAKRIGPANTPVMYDYETFHGKAGTPGAMNYLFLDGHVGDLK